MMKVMILLLLIVHVFGKKPVPDNPYPGHIKKKIIYNPSIPIAHSGGTTVLKANDDKVAKLVDILIDHVNSDLADEGDKLEVQKTGKVELKVIDERQHMPYEPYRFIKNIYTFKKIICISKDRHSEVNVHGTLLLMFDQDEDLVDSEIFVNYTIRNRPVPREIIRGKSVPGDINDRKENENDQRRHSFH